MIRPHGDKLIALSRLLDSLVISLTLWSILELNQIEWANRHTWWLLISVVSFVIFAELNELYRQNRGTSVFWKVNCILFSWACTLLVLITIYPVYPEVEPVYKNIFWMWAAAVPIEILSWHIIVSSCAGILRKMGRNSRRVAIVGVTPLGTELHKIFLEDDSMGFNFVGFFDERQIASAGRGTVREKIAGNMQQLVESARTGSIDIVYIALSLSAEKRIKNIIEQLSDSTVSIYYVPDFLHLVCSDPVCTILKGYPSSAFMIPRFMALME